ncbi:MAG: polysaccharide biosynthesis C-terminal domain-containing protein [Actinomycetota bacterium]
MTTVDRPRADGSGAEPAAGSVDRAARGTALNLAGSVVVAVVSFVTVGVVTNVHGQRGAGVFFAATAAFTLAANGARLGAESGLMFFVSRLRADGRQRELRSVIRTALVATGAVTVVLAIAGVGLAPTISGLIAEQPRYRDTATTMVRVLAVAVPTFALSQVMIGASRGFGTMRPSVVAGQLVRPVTQLTFVVVATVMSDEVWPLAVAWALSSVLTMGTIGTWLRRRLRRVDVHGDPAPLDRGRYWRYTGPRAVADLLSAMLERLDILLVAFLIDEAAAGVYGTSNRLILAGQMMMVATAQSMAPLLAANFLHGRHDDAQRVLRTISGWNVTLLWPVFLGLAFGAETALSVFGPEFSAAAPLVVVLSLAFLVITGLGVGDTLLLMTGDSIASLINHAIALAVMVGAALILLPTTGIVGAAWAWALSRVTLRVLAVVRVWHTRRVHAIGRPVLTAAAVALAAYVPSGLLAHLVTDDWPAVAAHAALGGATQLVLVRIWRDALQIDQLLAVLTRRATPAVPVQSTEGADSATPSQS